MAKFSLNGWVVCQFEFWWLVYFLTTYNTTLTFLLKFAYSVPLFRWKTGTTNSSVWKVKSKYWVVANCTRFTRETCNTYPSKLVSEGFTVEKQVLVLKCEVLIQTQFIFHSWSRYILKRKFFNKFFIIHKSNFHMVLLLVVIPKSKFHKILLDWFSFIKINSAKLSENFEFV